MFFVRLVFFHFNRVHFICVLVDVDCSGVEITRVLQALWTLGYERNKQHEEADQDEGTADDEYDDTPRDVPVVIADVVGVDPGADETTGT